MFSLARRVPRSNAFRAFSSEIPINKVASVWKLNVGNEANALVMDGVIKDNLKVIEKAPGFVKAERTVCKSEWAYETAFVFDSLDSFKAWKGSEEFKGLMDKAESNFEKIGVKMADVYNGARVYDDL